MNKFIYFAGGCFWGIQKLFDSIKGVVFTRTGYANGDKNIVGPSYEEVKTGKTGYKETVEVEYDDSLVSLSFLVHAFYAVIDPSMVNQQGHDVGTQYQTGIFYVRKDLKDIRLIKEISKRVSSRYKDFSVIVEPLVNFYGAEEYHQKYLEKNPNGYCHLDYRQFERVKAAVFDPDPYEKLHYDSFSIYSQNLNSLGLNEIPNSNESLVESNPKGLFVDALSGEPLFSSRDKFLENYGLITFSRLFDPNVLIEKIDTRFGKTRIELFGRTSLAHIGYVIYDDELSPSGVNYRINSAAIRFIPVNDMKSEGYSFFLRFVD